MWAFGNKNLDSGYVTGLMWGLDVASNTWAFGGDAGSKPSPRKNALLAYVEDRNEIWMYGGYKCCSGQTNPKDV